MEITTRVDDIDRTQQDAERYTFSLEGTSYEIDLAEDHAAELREALARFIRVARARSKPPAPTKTGTDPAQLAAIRAWAHSHGYQFSDQGRIPNHVREAYDKLAGKTAGKERIFSEAGNTSG